MRAMTAVMKCRGVLDLQSCVLCATVRSNALCMQMGSSSFLDIIG